MSVISAEPTNGLQFVDLASFSPASLSEVVEHANLAQRVDRKYLADLETVRRLCDGLVDTHKILQIGDRHTTTYSTTYFDTPDLMSCRAHVQGRRRRWKVRSRLYVEDNLCRVEVKTKSGRGATIKDTFPSHVSRYGKLCDDELDFVADTLFTAHPEVDVKTLAPRAEITYLRACLVDLAGGTRVTIDGKLTSVLREGRAWVDDGYAIVETKGGVLPAEADLLLRRLGARPRSFSKYVATTSLVHPKIADNDVRALNGKSLHSRLS
ncbi:MAG: VTC domain-containing protein [Aeromicrobium sp.]